MNIVLVDDHQMVREGFAHILSQEPGYEVIGSYNSFDELHASNIVPQTDLLISDISLPDKNGFEIVQYARSVKTTIKCIMLSMYENHHYLSSALDLDVNGFISKRDASDVIIDAIEAVMDGETYFSDLLMTDFASTNEKLEDYYSLTDREKEIFTYFAEGYEVKRIANKLKIATKTVHAHRRNIYLKLGFSSPFQLVKFATRYSLVESR